MKAWFDVDDLFFFARRSLRPTGIQRLSGEAYGALMQIAPTSVGFVVHDAAALAFRTIEWAQVKEAYLQLTTGPKSSEAPPAPPKPMVQSLVSRLLGCLFGNRTQGVPEGGDSKYPDLRELVSRDDVLCSLGAPWHHPHYSTQVAELTRSTGIRSAMMVHDLIPILHPEFFEAGRSPNFPSFMRDMLPMADILLTNSQSTAADVLRWSTSEGLPLKNTPRAIPIAHGFTRPPPAPLPRVLEAQQFVLFVSTIETRKNHVQIFRVWCRLLQDLPRERVPTLVFAGSIGWMVDDLMKAIENTNRLDGKLILLHDADDATLSALYRGCSFTLFPSHYEGWGLPVSDSLSFGKLCVASSASSIPEAGGSYCIYIDPDNATGAYNIIRELIELPDLLRKKEEFISTSFRPLPWTETAKAILEAIS